MELLLNLIWITVVTLLCVGVWRNRLNGADPKHSWSVAAVAVVCIAALIFPAISLSDDLHIECTAIESPGKRIHQLIVNVEQTGVVIALWTSMLLASIFSAQAKRNQFDTGEAATAAPLEGFLPPSLGRAPPFLPV